MLNSEFAALRFLDNRQSQDSFHTQTGTQEPVTTPILPLEVMSGHSIVFECYSDGGSGGKVQGSHM